MVAPVGRHHGVGGQDLFGPRQVLTLAYLAAWKQMTDCGVDFLRRAARVSLKRSEEEATAALEDEAWSDERIEAEVKAATADLGATAYPDVILRYYQLRRRLQGLWLAKREYERSQPDPDHDFPTARKRKGKKRRVAGRLRIPRPLQQRLGEA
jgi:hypothetical protein